MKLPIAALRFDGSGPWGVTARGFRTEDAEVRGDELVVQYPRGSYKPGGPRPGGLGFYASPPGALPAARSAELRYRVWFPADFDFVKGGKLPGLYVGERGASGGKFADDAASCRVMWRQDGQAEAYVYPPAGTGRPAYLDQVPGARSGGGAHGDSLWRGAWTFRRGGWNDVRLRLELNDPARADGALRLEINGVARECRCVRWRTDARAAVSGIVFHTFFGGADESWATPRAASARFAGVSVSAA